MKCGEWMGEPLVSVIIPTHNRLEYLKKALASITSQTYPHIEIIVVNDGSVDGTKDFLESVEKRRLRVFHNKQPQGACHARNVGIQAAWGELLTFLDDDDEFLPQRLERMVAVYDSKWSYIATGYYYVTESGQICKIPPKIITEKVMSFKNVAGNSILVERERVLEIGGFDTSLTSSQDYDVFFRLNKMYGDALAVEEPLYLIHADYAIGRITTSMKRGSGHFAFYKKHKNDIGKKARASLLFRILAYRDKGVSLKHALFACSRYMEIETLRYYLGKKFPVLKKYYGEFKFWKRL